MNFRVARYVHAELDEGWRGWVLAGVEGLRSGSQITNVQLDRDGWSAAWKAADIGNAVSEPEHILKTSAEKTVSRLSLPLPQGPVEVICKHVHPRGFWGRLLSRIFDSKERAGFERGNHLLDAGLRTPLPLASLQRTGGGLGREVATITEAVIGAVDLDRAATVEITRLNSVERHRAKRDISRSLVEMLAGLQKLDWHHRDMKATNILVTGLIDRSDPVEAVLVDLDALRRRRWFSGKQQWQPLMRLNASLGKHRAVTNTDRLRVLRGYLEAVGQGSGAAKGYWRILEVWSRRYLRGQLRRSRSKYRRYTRDD